MKLGDATSLAGLRPAPGSSDPMVWVERLAVYKDTPSDASLLRKVDLRRGLNILWAETKKTDAPEGRLAGHGAGKTTFCRLLRYALGDAKPGNQQFRASFRASFPNGWVLADVWVDSVRWLAARPLGELGHHPWAVRGGSLLELPESPPRGCYRDYEAALNDAVFRNLPKRELSGSGTQLDWPMLLPWLTRDQEAHYSGLTEWRAKESESESPGLSAPDRENLMRLVLGVVKDAEQEKLRLRESKAQEHERKLREKPKHEYHLDQARERLEELFPDRVGHPGDLLFADAVRRRVASLRQQAEEFEGMIAKQRGSLIASSKNAAQAKQAFATTTYIPFRGYCSTPLVLARRRNCPCITERPDDDEVKKKTEAIAQNAGGEKERLAELEKDLTELKFELTRRNAARESARRQTTARRDIINAQVEELTQPQQQAADLEAAYNSYTRAADRLQSVETDLETLSLAKDKLDKELATLSKQNRDAMTAFGNLFNLIVRSMLGPAVTGRVEFAGKSLEPALHFHGSYSSAAPNLTKILAFDIAALALSLFEGIGHQSRFLLHDSPRTSDLAPPIYDSLFKTAQALEAACGDNPGFQYIITTTSAPPSELQDAPWLIQPKLDATQAELRFLGVDLG